MHDRGSDGLILSGIGRGIDCRKQCRENSSCVQNGFQILPRCSQTLRGRVRFSREIHAKFSEGYFFHRSQLLSITCANRIGLNCAGNSEKIAQVHSTLKSKRQEARRSNLLCLVSLTQRTSRLSQRRGRAPQPSVT